MGHDTWTLMGVVVSVLALSVGTALAAEASIIAVEPVDTVDRDGDGAMSAFDLQITADTNCVGCNDESDDDPNVDPFFKVFVVGADGNEVELEATEEVENGDEVVITYAVDDTIIQQFDPQNLEVRVELWDSDLMLDEEMDEQSLFVDYEPPEDDQEAPDTPTDTETASTPTTTETARSTDEGADEAADVTFDSQTANGTAVTVSSTVMPEGGFILVYDTTMAAPLGTSAFLEAGTTENVSVSFNQVLTENATLLAFAIEDTNGNQQYDPGTDEVYIADQQPVVEAAAVNSTTG